jgi:hypothetical protein
MHILYPLPASTVITSTSTNHCSQSTCTLSEWTPKIGSKLKKKNGEKYFQKRDTRTFSSTEEAVQEQISTASELEREREKRKKTKENANHITYSRRVLS